MAIYGAFRTINWVMWCNTPQGHKGSGLSDLSNPKEIIIGSGSGLEARKTRCFDIRGMNPKRFHERGDIMRGSGLIWTIVGILAIIALLIFIFSAL